MIFQVTQANSRCYCKEMPPTTGWKFDVFYPQHVYRKSGILFHKKTLSKTQAFMTSVCCMTHAQLEQGRRHYVVRTGLRRVSRAYMTEFSWKQLCRFPGWSADENNPDFFYPLAVFCYINFCYLAPTATSQTENIPAEPITASDEFRDDTPTCTSSVNVYVTVMVKSSDLHIDYR